MSHYRKPVICRVQRKKNQRKQILSANILFAECREHGTRQICGALTVVHWSKNKYTETVKRAAFGVKTVFRCVILGLRLEKCVEPRIADRARGLCCFKKNRMKWAIELTWSPPEGVPPAIEPRKSRRWRILRPPHLTWRRVLWNQ